MINTQGSGSAGCASVAVVLEVPVLEVPVLAVLVVAVWGADEEELLPELHAAREKKMTANKIAEKRGKVSIWSLYLHKWALSIEVEKMVTA